MTQTETELTFDTMAKAMLSECHTCRGTGGVATRVCLTCEGTGVVLSDTARELVEFLEAHTAFAAVRDMESEGAKARRLHDPSEHDPTYLSFIPRGGEAPEPLELPELESVCRVCDAEGCCGCGGKGLVPSKAGSTLLDFLDRHRPGRPLDEVVQAVMDAPIETVPTLLQANAEWDRPMDRTASGPSNTCDAHRLLVEFKDYCTEKAVKTTAESILKSHRGLVVRVDLIPAGTPQDAPDHRKKCTECFGTGQVIPSPSAVSTTCHRCGGTGKEKAHNGGDA
ncbi:MAG: hypothetical protein ACYTG0_12590 [Planctomycetota bacterium]